jgi:hypothetical protein
MKRLLKYAATTVAALLAVAMLLLWDDFTSKVVVENLASHDLTEVEVGVGDAKEASLREVFWRGDIKRGQTQYIGRVASHEGSIAIRFKRAGERLAFYRGYVSGDLMPARYRVCVRDTGEPVFKVIPPFLGRFSVAIGSSADAPPPDCRAP